MYNVVIITVGIRYYSIFYISKFFNGLSVRFQQIIYCIHILTKFGDPDFLLFYHFYILAVCNASFDILRFYQSICRSEMGKRQALSSVSS